MSVKFAAMDLNIIANFLHSRFFAAHLHFELFVERVVVVDVQGRVLTLLLRRVMTLVVDGGVATFDRTRVASNDTENFETNMIFLPFLTFLTTHFPPA